MLDRLTLIVGFAGVLAGFAAGVWAGNPAPEFRKAPASAQAEERVYTASLELEREASVLKDWKRGDRRRGLKILAEGRPEELRELLAAVGSREVLSSSERELLHLLLDRLGSRDDEQVIDWILSTNAWRLDRDVISMVAGECCEEGKLGLVQRLLDGLPGTMQSVLGSAILFSLDEDARLGFFTGLPPETRLKVYQGDSDAVMRMIVDHPESTGELLDGLKDSAHNSGSIEYRYLDCLAGQDLGKALDRIAVAGKELGQSYVATLIPKFLGKVSSIDEFKRVIALVELLRSPAMRTQLYAGVGEKLVGLDGGLEMIGELDGNLNDAEFSALRSSMVVASGKESPESIEPLLDSLGSSEEADQAVTRIFSDLAQANEGEVFASAVQLENERYRSKAISAVTQEWAARDPRASLTALAGMGDVERAAYESWIEGVKHSDKPEFGGMEVAALLTEARSVLGPVEFEELSDVAKERLSKSEAESLPQELRSLFAP